MIESQESTAYLQLLQPALSIIIAIIAGFFLEYVVLRWLKALAHATHWPGDDLLIASLRGMMMLWCLLLGIYVASFQLPALPSLVLQILYQSLIVLLLLSFTIVAVRITTGLINQQDTTSKVGSVSILNNIIRAVVGGIGILLIVQYMGISVTPVLAALAASSLGLSLALQETLSNLFSGIWLVASNQIRPGHYVRLGTGDEGYVSDINWRTTNIRQLANNMIIVPNTAMTSAIVINYYDPEQELAILIDVGVSYDSDLEHVERVTIDVASEVMRDVAGGVPDFEPFIRYNRFNDSSINFTVILRGQEYVNQYLIKHEFVKRLHQRYKADGIVIPFPIRTLHMPHAEHLTIRTVGASNGAAHRDQGYAPRDATTQDEKTNEQS